MFVLVQNPGSGPSGSRRSRRGGRTGGARAGRPRQAFVEAASEPAAPRGSADDAVVELLREHLAPAVFDEPIVRDFLHRYGPFDPERAGTALYDVLGDGPAEHHVSIYLQAIREALR